MMILQNGHGAASFLMKIFMFSVLFFSRENTREKKLIMGKKKFNMSPHKVCNMV